MQKSTSKNKLSVILANFRSLFDKLDNLKALMYTCDADIVLGTETWLSVDTENSELNLPDEYAIFRQDRASSRGGGVIIAIKKKLCPLALVCDSTLEILWVTARLAHVTCVIGVCYRPPDSRPEFVELLNDSLQHVLNKYSNAVVILGGDFNYPGIDWSASTVSCTSHRQESLNFMHLTHEHHMSQLVTEPTRGKNILDLILTNHPDNAVTHVLEEISDHRVVHCSLSLPRCDKIMSTKPLLNYACANVEKMNRMLADFTPRFEANLENCTANENWIEFRDLLKQIEHSCVPRMTISSATNDPWFTQDVKRSLNKKKRAFRKASRTNATEDWHNYKNISRESEAIIKDAKHKYFNHTLPNLLKTDPKKFWRVVNPKDSNDLTLLEDELGYSLSPEDTVETFSNQFASIFSDELPIDLQTLTETFIHVPFSPIVITENGVTRAIERLEYKTTPGPDGISTKLLKLTSQKSAYLLKLIFQQSLDTGCVPEDWKSAFVKPIFKSGLKSQANNYRPISLTSIPCKILEHILFTHIISHLNSNNLLIDNQHGFRTNRSCDTQLFELLTDLHDSMNNSRYTDAIFIDFSKAFDRVQHKRLMVKIRNLHLDDKTTQWIKSFLTNRVQSVKLNNVISSPSPVKSGVPQGSVLGPLLFLVYINDIGSNINSSLRLFADDVVIYKPISKPNDITVLQSDLTKLSEWCRIWQMEINVNKTKHVRFSSVADPSPNVYSINNIVIQTVPSIKYLGILFHFDLSWTSHVEYITGKALRKLGLLKRRLKLANKDTKLHAYNAVIRPTLEYASIVWHPHTAVLTEMLESVQNKAARFILSCYSRYESVSSIKQSLNLSPLAMRRKFSRLSFFHRLYHNDSPFRRTFIHPASYTSLRNDHDHKIEPVFSRTKKHQFSPLALSINEWNSLPSSVVAHTLQSTFKTALLAFLETDNQF